MDSGAGIRRCRSPDVTGPTPSRTTEGRSHDQLARTPLARLPDTVSLVSMATRRMITLTDSLGATGPERRAQRRRLSVLRGVSSSAPPPDLSLRRQRHCAAQRSAADGWPDVAL
jgi:hypothetical protein